MGCNHHTPNLDAGLHLLSLWRELLELSAAYSASCEINAYPDSDGPIWSRVREIDAAIQTARPVDPIGLAVQARCVERSLDTGWSPEQIVLVDAMAAALARLGGVEVERDPDIRRGGDRS